MRNTLIITLLIALFASCSNQSRLYVGDSRLYIDGTTVGEIAPYETANIRTTDKALGIFHFHVTFKICIVYTPLEN